MPATNYTPIQLYRSTTSGALPSNANLSPGEVALNIADNDMSMYFENASGTVKKFFNNPAALTYPTADGTSGQFLTTNGGGVLSFASVAAGALTNNTRQAVTSSATTTINLNSGNVIDLTMAASITSLSFTNVPASGTPILIQIVVKNASNGAPATITWPNSVYWSGQYSVASPATVQTAPTLATGANGVTVIALLTTDGGTKWRGWVEATIPGGTVGSLYTWGNYASGRLGQNTSVYRSSPVQVGALTNWASVSAGGGFCAAIKTDGTLWTWGLNNGGQLGISSLSNTSSPVQVGALTNWLRVSASVQTSHCAAIKTDGTLWTWGSNGEGQLGQNITTSIYRSSPVQVGALTSWGFVTTGASSCAAIKTDGTLWTWGRGQEGMLGQNNTTSLSSPVQVGALTNWASVALTFHCAAIKTDGTLWTWGSNSQGALGQNDTTYRSSPVQVGALTNWASIATANPNCAAIKTDGTLWTWGYNSQGQLGLGDTTSRSSPVQVGALTNWSSIAAGNNTCSSIKTDGTLWVWGRNSNGQLGTDNRVYVSSPVQVGALTSWVVNSSGVNFTAAISGSKSVPA